MNGKARRRSAGHRKKGKIWSGSRSLKTFWVIVRGFCFFWFQAGKKKFFQPQRGELTLPILLVTNHMMYKFKPASLCSIRAPRVVLCLSVSHDAEVPQCGKIPPAGSSGSDVRDSTYVIQHLKCHTSDHVSHEWMAVGVSG